MRLILLLLCFLCGASSAKSWTYVSFGGGEMGPPDSLTIDADRGRLYAGTGEHAYQQISFCAPAQDSYCFDSPSLVFAVPKRGVRLGDSWRHDNPYNSGTEEFNVTGKFDLVLVGRKISCFVIENKKSRTTYFYSNRFGLMALRHRVEGEADYDGYLVESQSGFPF